MDNLRNNALKHEEVVTHLAGLGQPAVFLKHELLHFIVSAPQPQGGMMADPFYVFNKFLTDVGFKGGRQLIYGAGEHEILPDHQPHFIAEVVEPVAGIIAASPYADGVVVGKPGFFKQLRGGFRRHPA